jgi:hypothetical protein
MNINYMKTKKPAMKAAPVAAETLRAVVPLPEGAAAGASSPAGPEAGPSTGVDSLPGAGGEEASLLGEEAESWVGEAAGMEEEGVVGEVAEPWGEAAVGVEAEAWGVEAEACGAEEDDWGVEAAGGDDEGVVGEDFGDGEAVGVVVGAWVSAAAAPAMATKMRAKTTTTWRAISKYSFFFCVWIIVCIYLLWILEITVLL